MLMLVLLVADEVGLMPDHKAGVPRSSYKGVLVYRLNGHRVFLAPADL